MDEQPNSRKIENNITGNISGNISMGDHNTLNAGNVAGQAAAPTPPGSLPQGSRLRYPRNALFTGRTEALSALEAALLPGLNDPQPRGAVVAGMGGVGKTQLAVEFAYRFGHRFESVHWLDLMQPGALEAEIAACGRAMGIEYDKHPQQVAATLRAWQAAGPRLLILDNFEAASEAASLLAPLFSLPGLRLLVTSRRADFPPSLGWSLTPLGSFTPAESAQFLRSRVHYEAEQAASLEKVAKALGRLPLALELAASYMSVTQVGADEYLAELEQTLAHESMNAGWFDELEIASPTGHPQGLLATFELSWAQVTGESAQTLFKRSGYLAANQPLPLELFLSFYQSAEPAESPKKGKAPRGDPAERALRRDLYRLGTLSLLQFDGERHSIHPLLAAYARSLDEGQTLLNGPAEAMASLD
jgi:hypothetical protein